MGLNEERVPVLDKEALAYHAKLCTGKVSINPMKALEIQRNMSFSYRTGLAFFVDKFKI